MAANPANARVAFQSVLERNFITCYAMKAYVHDTVVDAVIAHACQSSGYRLANPSSEYESVVKWINNERRKRYQRFKASAKALYEYLSTKVSIDVSAARSNVHDEDTLVQICFSHHASMANLAALLVDSVPEVDWDATLNKEVVLGYYLDLFVLAMSSEYHRRLADNEYAQRIRTALKGDNIKAAMIVLKEN